MKIKKMIALFLCVCFTMIGNSNVYAVENTFDEAQYVEDHDTQDTWTKKINLLMKKKGKSFCFVMVE